MEKEISRRSFLRTSALALGAIALSETKGARGAVAAEQKQTKVFFTDDISVNGLQKIYSRINQGMTGRIGIKLHTGEPHGPNLLPIELIRGLQTRIPNSTIVECNVLYPSPRQNTKGHLETIKTNGFDFCPVDIMDAEGHATLPIPGMQEFLDEWMSPALKQRPFTPGVHLTEIAVGKNLLNYDSLLAYTHFKGHTSGGFGGSLKNIAIGCSSGKLGKRQIHGEGWPKGPLFLERMVEAGKGISAHFGPRITYINVLKPGHRHRRLDGPPGRGQSLGRPGIRAAGSGTARHHRAHREPERPAPAGIHEDASDGQRPVQVDHGVTRTLSKRRG
jgi:hypothetical protein